ncbi:hypothetical protein GCM10023063_07000 [Arthrobacter methylotrophus]|uniref:hypothetical protein n=1 Tax=Arthrobacter methylotrophus TaxID=121291 RepID=UPI003387E9EF
MTHWLVGSLRECFWDKAPDGGALDGGASFAVGAGTGVVVAAVGVGVAVGGPEGGGAGAGDAARVSGVQAAKAVSPTPAASSAVNDLRLVRQL